MRGWRRSPWSEVECKNCGKRDVIDWTEDLPACSTCRVKALKRQRRMPREVYYGPRNFGVNAG